MASAVAVTPQTAATNRKAMLMLRHSRAFQKGRQYLLFTFFFLFDENSLSSYMIVMGCTTALAGGNAMPCWKSALCAAMALVSVPAAAQDVSDNPSRWAGSEVAVGVLEHGSNFHPLGKRLVFDKLPAGQIYEGQEEAGTVDVQLVYRTAPLRLVLKPRLAAKVQVNTADRTSFASLGAEWRQHLFHGRIYGQAGIGLTIHDGYRFTPDPFDPSLPIEEARRRYDIYRRHTSFGSQVLFNPNASVGIRLRPDWAVEATWEHFSHHQVFAEQNPGIDNLGLRLVHMFGARR